MCDKCNYIGVVGRLYSLHEDTHWARNEIGELISSITNKKHVTTAQLETIERIRNQIHTKLED